MSEPRCQRCRSAYGEIAYSAAVEQWLCRRCYESLPSARSHKPAGPTVRLPRPKPVASESHTAFVYRVWDLIEQRTGYAPQYVGPRNVVSYCPRCLDGTVRWTFIKAQTPSVKVSSQGGGEGRCSRGCSEFEIGEALR